MTTDLSYGIGRVYQAFTEAFSHPPTHRAFRTYDAALVWLLTDPDS